MVEGKKYKRFELVITRAVHEANVMNKRYPDYDPVIMPKLSVKKESAPRFGSLQELLKDVGAPYEWDRRAEYHDAESIKEITKSLKATGREFSFWSGSKTPVKVGGVIVANVEKNVGGIFEFAARLPHFKDLTPEAAQNYVEVFKIGLYPQYTRLGWGPILLGKLLTELFDKSANKPDVVYLNTRSTNHAGVLGFYEKMGFELIGGFDYPNDILSDEQIAEARAIMKSRQKPAHASRVSDGPVPMEA